MVTTLSKSHHHTHLHQGLGKLACRYLVLPGLVLCTNHLICIHLVNPHSNPVSQIVASSPSSSPPQQHRIRVGGGLVGQRSPDAVFVWNVLLQSCFCLPRTGVVAQSTSTAGPGWSAVWQMKPHLHVLAFINQQAYLLL